MIEQAGLSFGAIAASPLAWRALRAEGRVSVQLHPPVSSLDPGGFDTPASKEVRMNNVLKNYT